MNPDVKINSSRDKSFFNVQRICFQFSKLQNKCLRGWEECIENTDLSTHSRLPHLQHNK